MAGAVQDRGTFRGIALTLLALALLAERAAARSLPVRFLVLVVLFRAEAIACRFISREIEADGWCLDGPLGRHYGAADAQLLALRLRMLAAVLGALADAEEAPGDRPDRSPAGWTPSHAAPRLPLILVFRLPAARRPSRPP